MKAKSAVVAGVILALSVGAACAQDVRIALQDDPDTLDPAKNWTFVGRHVLASLCDKLVDISTEGSIVPQLATEWTTTADGKSVTLKLRPGVKFHDGEPMDAAAVKYSLDRDLNLPGSRRKTEISAISNVVVIDPLTVRLDLSAPFSPLIAQFTDRAGIIISPKAAEAAGDKFDAKPVCAGPYKFVERVPQDRIVLEKFDDYWDKEHFFFHHVTFLPISDASVRFANLQAGQLDIIERLAPTDLDVAKRDSRVAYAKVTGLGYQNITFNIGNGPKADNPFGRDKRLREAFELSLDRKVLNDVVFAGEFTVGNQPFPPGNPYYAADLPVPERDLAKAKALIKESGVEHPSFTLMVPTNNELQPAAQLMQSMAKEAGIDVKLQSIELVTELAQGREGKFEANFIGWSGRVDPDGNIHLLLSCKAAGNDGHYCNPEFDRLLEAARTTSEPAARKALYEKAVHILLDERPDIYLYHQNWIFGLSSKIAGFKAYPDGLIRLRDTHYKS